MRSVITNPTLPAGWTSEDLGSDQLLIVGWTSVDYKQFVTVDFRRRGFRGGFSTHGAMHSQSVYTGRGWSQRLVADAVAWLRAITESSTQ